MLAAGKQKKNRNRGNPVRRFGLREFHRPGAGGEPRINRGKDSRRKKRTEDRIIWSANDNYITVSVMPCRYIFVVSM
jgi:hypothetical protein